MTSSPSFPLPAGLTFARPRSAAQQALLLEEKRAYLRKHPVTRQYLFEPSQLWTLVVRHRYRPEQLGRAPADDNDDDDIQGYSDLRLSFDGYKRIAYTILFGDPPEAALSEAEKENIFFTHPFLNPKAFLIHGPAGDVSLATLARAAADNSNTKVERAIQETVPSVPLYAYIAKKMLLFRLRVMLELIASVPPPALRVEGDAATVRCAPSPSSPLSNGLTQKDIEAFIKELLPHIRVVRDMPSWMEPYYLCHSARKIMFMLDHRAQGAVSIETFMSSEVFSDLLLMYESETRDAVVVFPVGSVAEVHPDMLLASGAEEIPSWVAEYRERVGEEGMLPCGVEAIEGDGNLPEDVYKIGIACPKILRVPGEPISRFTAAVARGALKWCPATTEYIAPDAMGNGNWFSIEYMNRVYEHFTQLDIDCDGVLTKEEFARYSNGGYTDLVIDRVFELYVAGHGEYQVMDYNTYLNFVVATDHMHTAQSRTYLWSLLDLEHTKSYIKIDVLRCFCKELSRKLQESELMIITADNILSEIIDMINPMWHEWVSLEDLARCNHQAIILPILLNYRSFFAYDSREQSAAHQASAEYVS